MLLGTIWHDALRIARKIPAHQLAPILKTRFPSSQFDDKDYDFIAQTSAQLVQNKDLAWIFEKGLTEIPVQALLKDDNDKQIILSGKIDALILDEDKKHAHIIDYKSDANPPQKIDDIPLPYQRQLARYVFMISRIYADWTVSAALLWITKARLDVLPQNMLDYQTQMMISSQMRMTP